MLLLISETYNILIFQISMSAIAQVRVSTSVSTPTVPITVNVTMDTDSVLIVSVAYQVSKHLAQCHGHYVSLNIMKLISRSRSSGKLHV